MRLLMVLAMIISGYPMSASADGNLDNGKAVFNVCSACHGEQAQGSEDNEAPRLEGQYDWYLITQLENFRAGRRGNHEEDDNGQMMRSMALDLSDQDIEDVVAYIQTLTSE